MVENVANFSCISITEKLSTNVLQSTKFLFLFFCKGNVLCKVLVETCKTVPFAQTDGTHHTAPHCLYAIALVGALLGLTTGQAVPLSTR